MKKILMLGAALLTFQALPALAQDGGPPPAAEDGKPVGPDKEGRPHHDFFAKQDVNKDGKISKEEALAAAAERFDTMDADKDGFVTKEEAKAAREKMHEKFKEMRGKKGEGKPGSVKEGPKAE